MYASIDSGDVIVNFTIENTGEGDLEFSFDKFLPDSLSVKKSKNSIIYTDKIIKGQKDFRVGQPVLFGFGDDGENGFGYSWQDSKETNGPNFEWIDISSIGTQLYLGDDSYQEVSLPFTFSFYDEDKTSVFVSSNGFLTFSSEDASSFSNQQLPDASTPNDLIALLWTDLNPDSGGNVYYFGDTDNFIVQYDNVPLYGGGGNYTFQVILSKTGSIKIQYLTITGYVNYSTTGIENSDGTDGLLVAFNTNYIEDNLAILISERPGFITNVDPVSGLLIPGQNISISATLSSTDLVPDNYTEFLTLTSNDPVSPNLNIPITLHVNGIPSISVDTLNLNFEEVFINYSDSLKVIITNSGTDSLFISDIISDNDVFVVNIEDKSFKLFNSESKEIYIYFNPVNITNYSGTLTINSNASNNPTINISLNGAGILPPQIIVTPDSLSADLYTGDTLTQYITIDNSNGRSDLNFDISILNVSKSSLKSKTTSTKNRNIGFHAIEARNNIQNNKLILQNNYINPSDIGDILETYNNFPEENTGMVLVDNYIYVIEYNNQLLTKYNISTQQIIDSFNIHGYPSGIAYDGQYLWIGNDVGNVYGYDFDGNNIGSFSCPFYMYPTLTWDGEYFLVNEVFVNNPTFYKVDYDNTIINSYTSTLEECLQIAWMSSINNDQFWGINEFNKSIMGLSIVDNSVVVNSEIPSNSDSYGTYSLIHDGTDLYISDWDGPLYRIDDGINNISWIVTDTTFGSIPAGASQDIAISYNAEGLYGGDYNSNIVISSNDPANPELTIPVYMKVTGAPNITISSDTISYEQVFVNYSGSETITIANNGADSLIVSNIISDNPVFNIDTTNFGLNPNESIEVLITYNPDQVSFDEGVISIHSNDSSNLVTQIYLSGNGVMPPVISLNKDSINTSILPGHTKSTEITVDNSEGGSDLFINVFEQKIITNNQHFIYTHKKEHSNKLSTHQSKIKVFTKELNNTLLNIISQNRIIFFDDMENETNGWSSEVYSGDDLWHQTDTNYYSESHSWYCGIDNQFNYETGNRINTAIISPEINLSSVTSDSLLLIFMESYDTEEGWDYCMVDISTDSGTTWIPLRGGLGYAPSGNSQGWITSIIDIADYIGETVKLRFYFDTGDEVANNFAGWFFDDVFISTTSNLTSWLQIEFNNYIIPAGSSQDITINFDAVDLEIGEYNSNIVFESNDPENPFVNIPVVLNVSEQMPPEIVNPIADKEVYITEKSISLDISNVFIDPNEDVLEYSISSQNQQIAVAEINENIANIDFYALGTTEILLSAYDGFTDTVETSFNLTVLDNNSPEIISDINDQTMTLSGDPIFIDLDTVFTDADNDVLLFHFESSDTSVVLTEIYGKILSITQLEVGFSIITVYADDGKGAYVYTSFIVNVTPGTNIIDNVYYNGVLENYPNPFTNKTTIKYFIKDDSKVRLRVFSIDGTLIEELTGQNQSRGIQLVEYNTSHLNPGIYLYQILFDDGRSQVNRMIKR